MNVTQPGSRPLTTPADDTHGMHRRVLHDLERQWLDTWRVISQDPGDAAERPTTDGRPLGSDAASQLASAQMQAALVPVGQAPQPQNADERPTEETRTKASAPSPLLPQAAMSTQQHPTAVSAVDAEQPQTVHAQPLDRDIVPPTFSGRGVGPSPARAESVLATVPGPSTTTALPAVVMSPAQDATVRGPDWSAPPVVSETHAPTASPPLMAPAIAHVPDIDQDPAPDFSTPTYKSEQSLERHGSPSTAIQLSADATQAGRTQVVAALAAWQPNAEAPGIASKAVPQAMTYRPANPLALDVEPSLQAGRQQAEGDADFPAPGQKAKLPLAPDVSTPIYEGEQSLERYGGPSAAIPLSSGATQADRPQVVAALAAWQPNAEAPGVASKAVPQAMTYRPVDPLVLAAGPFAAGIEKGSPETTASTAFELAMLDGAPRLQSGRAQAARQPQAEGDAESPAPSQKAKLPPPTPDEHGPQRLTLRELSEHEVLASMRDALLTSSQSQFAAQGLARALMEAGYARVQVVVNGKPAATVEAPSSSAPDEPQASTTPNHAPQESRHGHQFR